MSQTSDDLVARLAVVEDDLAIYRLPTRYGPSVDSEASPETEAIWTEDGVYNAMMQVRLGRRAIADTVAGQGYRGLIPSGVADVMCGVPAVTVNGDQAVATTYYYHAMGRA